MKLSKRFGLAAAFEELAEQEAVEAAEAEATEPVVEEAEIPVAEENVETSVADMEMADSELDQADETIDTAETDLGTLNDVADKMEATEETGGLDAGSAEIVQVAVEALYMRLGGIRSKPMPSMESFGADSSRKKATRIAVENIRERAKEIGKAILAMLQKAWDFVLSLIDKIFTASGRTRERAVKLKATLDKIDGAATSSAAEVDGTAFGKALAMAGDAGEVSSASIVKGLAMTNSKATNMLVNMSKISADKLGDFQQMINGTPDEFAKKIAPQFKFAENGFTKVTDEATFGKQEEGMVTFAVTEAAGLLGGTKIAIVGQEKVEDTFDSVTSAIKNTKVITVSGLTEKQQAPEAYAKMKTLSIDDCKAIADAVISAMGKVDEMKGTVAALKAGSSKLRTSLSGDVIAKIFERSSGVEEKKDVATGYVGSIRVAIKVLTSLASQPLIYFTKNTVVSSGAALQYAGLSAKTYGAAEAAPADEKKPEAAPAAA